MGILKPLYPIKNNRVIDLQRGNECFLTYARGDGRSWNEGTVGVLDFRDSAGQTLDVWDGVWDAATGLLVFSATTAQTNAIPAGTSWVLYVSPSAGAPDTDVGGISDMSSTQTAHIVQQGTVIRSEAPQPDNPINVPAFDGVQYTYSFSQNGDLVDPAWRVMAGQPHVYDNSSVSLPDGLGAGSLVGGDPTVFDDMAVLWWAPLNGDSVRLTYNTIRMGFGGTCELWVVLCSNYDMTNSAAIYHKQVPSSNDTIGVATGSGPTTYATRRSVSSATLANQTFTAEYNQVSNTFAVYQGTDLSNPIVSWADSTELVDHGPGDRYLGFAMKAGLLFPGVEVSDWLATDVI